MSVYFAQAGRYIKIGYSEQPERRVAKLWQSSTRYARPWDLSIKETPHLVAAIDGEKSDEAACHRALRNYAVGGEWFVDEPAVREFIGRAERGDFSAVTRPGGEVVPVPFEQMLPERRIEIDRMLLNAQKRGRKAVAA